MNELNSLQHFIAFDQLKNDYKNLACHYEDFKLYRKGTSQYINAKKNCYNYLISIMVQKNFLNLDDALDQRLMDEIFERV